MLHLHRSERADSLLSALAELMAVPLPDPMAAELICVPSRGVERWLSQGLSARLGAGDGVGASDGVAANIEFPSPAALVGDVVAEMSGMDPREDPWNNGQAFWAVVAAIDANMDSDWMQLVASQIRSGESQGRLNRIRTARYIANLFTKYHQQRPEMIKAWAEGHDVGSTGEALVDSDLWQAMLWREVADAMEVPSPPQRIQGVCSSLADPAGSARLELPERISAFGLTRLPSAHLQILQGLAVHRDIHLFLLHPSPQLWDSVAAALAAGHSASTREEDPTALLVCNPLLASWGRDARELQVALARVGDVADTQAESATGNGPKNLLGQLQDDVQSNRPPIGADYAAIDPRPVCDPAADLSVQVHACHGEVRQVQVLRDAIMQLLDADPTLEPRDVIILCPDVEQFAPEIHAVFGATPELRVRLADRSVAQTNPLISAVALLVKILDSRLSAAEVMSLLQTPPVRERFGFTDEDIDRMHDWILGAGIRWGLDESHRQRWNLGGVAANTWSAGLDRLLLGVAMADEDLRMVGGAVPIDDVSSNDIQVAGRLAEFVERLGAAVEFFGEGFTLDQGVSRLLETVDALMDTGYRDAWQRQDFQRIMEELRPGARDASATGAADAILNFSEFRDVVDAELAGRPTRANFRTGHITVCTLTPMRSIPHRVVCLLGLDDHRFPRISRVSGDDLTRRPPFIGDQDGRGEDRQLVLDALLAAEDHLVVTYSGRDERSNAIKPPAVPLAELLSVIDRTVKIERDGGIVTHHPLQSFDPKNYLPGSLVPDRAWSYDKDSFTGAQAQQFEDQPKPEFLPAPLPAPENQNLSLDDLVRFVEHPVKAFVRTRLRIYLEDYEEALNNELTLSMDSLDDWAAGEDVIDVLSNMADGQAPAETALAWFNSATARGNLPPGAIARQRLRDDVYKPAAAIAALVRHARAGTPPRTVAVKVPIADDRLLLGSVSGVCGDKLIVSTFSKVNAAKKNPPNLRAKRRIATWVRLLALSASDPATGYTAHLISRTADPGNPLVLRMTPPENPAAVLGQIVELYDLGMQAPLPLYCETSHAYASNVAKNRHEAAMKQTWISGYDFAKEDQDQYHALVHEPIPTIADLLANSRFVECAHQLWDPLLAHEEVVDVQLKAGASL